MFVFQKNLYKILTQPRVVFSFFFPGKTSYSQSGEDMILDFLFRHKRKGFYVDVGANHPGRLSNTLFFYNQRGWTGINIEPNPILHKKFNFSRRRDINLNLGISKTKGMLQFFEIVPDTLSTFDVTSVEDYIDQGHKIKSTFQVQVETLENILEQNIGANNSIDFLSIDTEGFDMEVLESNNWNTFRPRAIILETLEYKKEGGGKKLNPEFDKFLLGHNYILYVDTYINSIYISKEFSKEIGFLQ